LFPAAPRPWASCQSRLQHRTSLNPLIPHRRDLLSGSVLTTSGFHSPEETTTPPVQTAIATDRAEAGIAFQPLTSTRRLSSKQWRVSNGIVQAAGREPWRRSIRVPIAIVAGSIPRPTIYRIVAQTNVDNRHRTSAKKPKMI